MKIHENGIKYQGSYEKDFLDLCEKMNINVVRGKTIKFRHKNKDKIYFSDYYLNDFNLIVEVKSWYIYELHEELNLVKQKAVLEQGYNFLFIIDKKYNDFLSIINFLF
jgi:very-short-patch-repair endonuclease